jgi:hypothetical protein
VLSDAEKKARYDEGVELEDIDNPNAGGGCGHGHSHQHHGHSQGGGGGGMDPDVLFQMFMQQQVGVFLYYFPWTKYGLLTFLTYTLTGLFTNNVFSFCALSFSDTSQGRKR